VADSGGSDNGGYCVTRWYHVTKILRRRKICGDLVTNCDELRPVGNCLLRGTNTCSFFGGLKLSPPFWAGWFFIKNNGVNGPLSSLNNIFFWFLPANPLPLQYTMTIVDKNRYCCRRHRLPPQSTTTAIAVINNKDRRCWLHPTRLLSRTTVIDKDRYRRRRHWPLPPLPTTAITTVNNDDWCRQLHPTTAASIDNNRRQQRPLSPPSTAATVDNGHHRWCQRRWSAPSAPSHCRLCQQQPSSTKTAITAAAIDRCRSRWRPSSPPSRTTISAVSFIPPPPPSTKTIVDKDQLANKRWVGAITAGQGHHHHHYEDGALDLPFQCPMKSAYLQSNWDHLYKHFLCNSLSLFYSMISWEGKLRNGKKYAKLAYF